MDQIVLKKNYFKKIICIYEVRICIFLICRFHLLLFEKF